MPTQLIEQTYDRWFWDERLSYQEPGDTSYATRRGKDGKEKKIYGKIFSIDKWIFMNEQNEKLPWE